jgi:hypothetical protein
MGCMNHARLKAGGVVVICIDHSSSRNPSQARILVACVSGTSARRLTSSSSASIRPAAAWLSDRANGPGRRRLEHVGGLSARLCIMGLAPGQVFACRQRGRSHSVTTLILGCLAWQCMRVSVSSWRAREGRYHINLQAERELQTCCKAGVRTPGTYLMNATPKHLQETAIVIRRVPTPRPISLGCLWEERGGKRRGIRSISLRPTTSSVRRAEPKVICISWPVPLSVVAFVVNRALAGLRLRASHAAPPSLPHSLPSGHPLDPYPRTTVSNV